MNSSIEQLICGSTNPSNYKQRKVDDPLILRCVEIVLEENGIYKTNLQQLKKKVQELLPNGYKHPSVTILS